MQIDYALILSAGLGSRMGEIGKVLPKVLWPIYFKTMLELQIRYCEELGIKKIYVNTHFLHDEINNFLVKTKLDSKITFLHEDVLLDSGGAIHNCARLPEVKYEGNLLLVNGDQFLFFEKEFWDLALKRLPLCRSVLFGIKVDKMASYNETVIENYRLVEIRKNTQLKNEYTTYSGLGLLNLNGLKPVLGISKFFETVANYKTEKIELVTPNSYEYWDFGTADVYVENIFKLNSSTTNESLMSQFLTRNLAFDGKKNNYIDMSKNALDLDYTGKFNLNCIQAKGLYQKI